jgi:hypothetical protein
LVLHFNLLRICSSICLSLACNWRSPSSTAIHLSDFSRDWLAILYSSTKISKSTDDNIMQKRQVMI